MIFNSRTRVLLAAALQGTIFVLAGGAAPQVAHAQAVVSTDEAKNFNVPAGPLDAALDRFARIAGVNLSYDAALVSGVSTRGLSGTHRTADALSVLLASTGVEAVPQAGGGYSLRKAPQRGHETILPMVRVTADEDAWGPVNGYVATRSATGTKTDTALIETPQSITVITKEQIAAQGSQSVAQVLRYAAGVNSETRGSMTALDFFYARGFPLNQYLDGTRNLNNGYSLPQPDPFFLERVEVVRGPASVLYGQADPGGVLNLVSKRPTDNTLGEAFVQIGSHGRKQLGFDASGTLSAENGLTGRVTMISRDADTQVDHAHESRVAIAPSLTWKNADTSLTLLANYQNDPDVGYYNWIPAYGTVLRNPYRPGEKLPTSLNTGEPSFDKYSRENYSVSSLFEHRFNETFLVRQSLRYSHVDSEFDNVYSSFLDSDFHTLNRYIWHLRDDMDALTADQHVQMSFATGQVTHTLITGFDYQQSRYRQRLGYDFGSAPPLDIYNPVYGQPIATPAFAGDALQKQYQNGVYAQDQMAIGNLRLLFGGRKDWARSDTHERMGNTKEEQDDDAFTGRAGIVYLFDNGWAPYASYTESFVPASGTDFSGKAFKPTEGKQWEAGLKYQPIGWKSFFMLSVYELKQSNVLTTDFAHPGESLQTGEIRSRGVELSGVANVTPQLKLIASYSHVDQEVTKGTVSFGPQEGNSPSVIPADTASLWAEYTFNDSALAGLGFGFGVRYIGSSWGDDENTFKVPHQTLADAAVHYDFQGAAKGWSLALNASNLFDKKYVAGCGGLDFCAYGPRRTLLGTVGKSW